jgi:F0F1-type ATP synthase delta subunit
MIKELKNIEHKYSENAISVINEIDETFDLEQIVEHACDYVSVYLDPVMDYVYANIEDAQELTKEEWKCLVEVVEQLINNCI